MQKVQLIDTIDALARVVSINEEQKQRLINKYIDMPDIEIIKDLSSTAYRVVGENSELYEYVLIIIRNINPSICPSVAEMKVILNKMFSNEVEGNMSLEENHKLVSESLRRFCTLFNQYGIDYYIVGALPCFLKTKQPLFRYHDDIDIMVNEQDIPKIAEIMELTGYKFQDDRFPSTERFLEMEQNKPPHTVLAQNPDNEFHLGFFCFRREQDNSITMREYSHRLENNEVIVDVLERQLDPEGTSLRYDDTPTTYMDTSFRTSSVESVYHLKGYTKRPKDITDMKKLEPFINQEKLKELEQHPQRNITFTNVDKNEVHKHM